MSHFTVLVVGPDIDDQLAPFYEGLEVDPYVPDSCTEGKILEDLQNCAEKIEAEATQADQAAKAVELRQLVQDILTQGYAAGARQHEALFREFAENYYGRDVNADLMPVSTYNPDSKWDWYVVGGRWAGFFRLKPNTHGTIAGVNTEAWHPAQRGKETAARSGIEHADSCRFGDIDIRGMKAERMWHARQSWREAQGKDEGARYFIYGIEPGMTRSQYLRDAGRFAFTTHAIVKDGQWIERGDMGWFGMIADEKEADTWLSQYEAVLQTIAPETVVTLVDCHI